MPVRLGMGGMLWSMVHVCPMASGLRVKHNRAQHGVSWLLFERPYGGGR